ncbi:MAG: hypothetical protein MUP58_00215 [Candidatus Nanohaloarchaeota archaeon QJJ-9]|nr:hypothetical protein [Candidatus Nanohaloarchaeota archaeon QJJ-9]
MRCEKCGEKTDKQLVLNTEEAGGGQKLCQRCFQDKLAEMEEAMVAGKTEI